MAFKSFPEYYLKKLKNESSHTKYSSLLELCKLFLPYALN